MLKTILVLALSASAALASEGAPLFNKRQLERVPCREQNLKDCGSGCIPLDYTCCPNGAGGCETTTDECQLGNNGQYLCCARGKVCNGAGGVNTQRFTYTSIIEGETSTSASTSTLTINVPDTPTTTSTLKPAETTPETAPTSPSISVPAVTDTPTSTFVAPTPSRNGNGTSTRPPPVTVNGGAGYGASFIQAFAAAAMALFAI